MTSEERQQLEADRIQIIANLNFLQGQLQYIDKILTKEAPSVPATSGAAATESSPKAATNGKTED